MNNVLRNLFILFFLFFSLPTYAQQIEWQQTIGGNFIDDLWSINQTSDGGYICGGFSKSGISGDKTEICYGEYDFWVVKLDATGNIQWQNTIGGSLVDGLMNISQTSDGGYICGGQSASDISIDKSENCQGVYDFWIVKLDSNGLIEWENTIGGSGPDALVTIKQTFDGGYICGGHTMSLASGDIIESSNGTMDFLIFKLDAIGNIQWQNTIGGIDKDQLQTLHQTADSGYVCGGISHSDISGDKTENSFGFADYWILKLDQSGNILWQKTYGGNDYDVFKDMSLTNDGGFICGGHSISNVSGNKTENNLGGFDCWILKLDSNGNIEWQNTIGGNLTDYFGSIKQSSGGGYFCAGYSISDDISGDKNEITNGMEDYWLFKLDSNGIMEWQNTIGGFANEQLSSLLQNSDGDLILGGQSQSDISGDKTENSQGTYDMWIVKIRNKFNTIQGTVFADLNSNNFRDSGEPGVPNQMLQEQNTGIIDFANTFGSYSLSVLDTGNFIIAPVSVHGSYNAIPATQNAYFPGILLNDSLNDFALQPNIIFNDLIVTITPTGIFRSGLNASYIINYKNVGPTTLMPTVIFYPDINIGYVSSQPVASSVTSDSVLFTLVALAPFESGQILINVSVNSGLPLSFQINTSAKILPISGDVNVLNNLHSCEALIFGSLDPNDILVNRDTLFTFDLVNPEPLEYIIRFQNTGNDTAFYVRVDNKISGDLQLGTFEFVASSHACNIEYQAYDSTMKFIFNNILLPDSNVNESASHGFVRYKIKPKTTLMAGDSIRNSAGIYFDYNAPVWTNTAVTEIVLPTIINEANEAIGSQIKVYPNPAFDNLSINIISRISGKIKVELFNVYGQKVYSLIDDIILSGIWEQSFKVKDLNSGLYFISVSGIVNHNARFIKY